MVFHAFSGTVHGPSQFSGYLVGVVPGTVHGQGRLTGSFLTYGAHLGLLRARTVHFSDGTKVQVQDAWAGTQGGCSRHLRVPPTEIRLIGHVDQARVRQAKLCVGN